MFSHSAQTRGSPLGASRAGAITSRTNSGRRVVDGRELELLLRAEVGEQAALAHPRGLGEPADRERLEALLGRERRGGVEDRLARPFAFRLQHDRPIISASDPTVPLQQRLTEKHGRSILASMEIDHITVFVRDYAASKRFYEDVLAPLGLVVLLDWPDDRRAYFGRPGQPSSVWLVESELGGRLEVALPAEDAGSVYAFHNTAIAAGARTEWAPGVRARVRPRVLRSPSARLRRELSRSRVPRRGEGPAARRLARRAGATVGSASGVSRV